MPEAGMLSMDFAYDYECGCCGYLWFGFWADDHCEVCGTLCRHREELELADDADEGAEE